MTVWKRKELEEQIGYALWETEFFKEIQCYDVKVTGYNDEECPMGHFEVTITFDCNGGI